jgi:hypothetical protein
VNVILRRFLLTAATRILNADYSKRCVQRAAMCVHEAFTKVITSQNSGSINAKHTRYSNSLVDDIIRSWYCNSNHLRRLSYKCICVLIKGNSIELDIVTRLSHPLPNIKNHWRTSNSQPKVCVSRALCMFKSCLYCPAIQVRKRANQIQASHNCIKKCASKGKYKADEIHKDYHWPLFGKQNWN